MLSPIVIHICNDEKEIKCDIRYSANPFAYPSRHLKTRYQMLVSSRRVNEFSGIFRKVLNRE